MLNLGETVMGAGMCVVFSASPHRLLIRARGKGTVTPQQRHQVTLWLKGRHQHQQEGAGGYHASLDVTPWEATLSRMSFCQENITRIWPWGSIRETPSEKCSIKKTEESYTLQKCQCHKRQRKAKDIFQIKGNSRDRKTIWYLVLDSIIYRRVKNAIKNITRVPLSPNG